jgi:sugar lactone lactonase YvrE
MKLTNTQLVLLSTAAIRAAVDSKGNVYVAGDEGRRLQRFKVVGPQ